MSSPSKGKQNTKGVRQIHEENKQTFKFYQSMGIGAAAVSFVMLCVYPTQANILLFIFALSVYIAAYQFATYIAKPKYNDSGVLLDGGIDLNMEGGIGENVKDIVIVTAGCQLCAAAISNYFWFIWLIAPFRAAYILWKHVLAPFFLKEPATAAQTEAEEKKRKKMERRAQRLQRQ